MNKKTKERAWAEELTKHLGVGWALDDSESPDFIVTEGDHKFGLEVTEIFAGEVSRKGSALKRDESDNHKAIEALRLEYEATHAEPLTVQFVGDYSDETVSRVVANLIAVDFPSKPIGHKEIIDEKLGLRIHATKGLRPIWYNVMDRVGWVDAKPRPKIEEAIKAKAAELDRYRYNAGGDIRLLIVADRINNSGKVALSDDEVFDLMGFEKVYFYSRPEGVIVLSK